MAINSQYVAQVFTQVVNERAHKDPYTETARRIYGCDFEVTDKARQEIKRLVVAYAYDPSNTLFTTGTSTGRLNNTQPSWQDIPRSNRDLTDRKIDAIDADFVELEKRVLHNMIENSVKRSHTFMEKFLAILSGKL